MRIALVSQEYPPETAHGGIASQTRLKAHGLAALGHDVTVISHSLDERRHETTDGAVRVIRIAGFDRQLPLQTDVARWVTYSAHVAGAVSELHSASPLDIVDFPEWASEGYVHLLNQAAWRHIPTVIQVHGPLVMLAHTIGWPALDSELYRTGTAMEAACLRLADAVFSSSRCSAEWCARHYGLGLERVPVLHTGVDTRHFRPGAVPKADRPTIVFVGRIAPSKGADALVEAACMLAGAFPSLRVQLVGRGEPSFVERLREIARVAGMPDMLEVAGYVHTEHLPGLLSRAHVFAAPSRYEGGPGFVYLEAMACGLPVIACEGSGSAEVVIPGENGLLVTPGDARALAAALGSLLADAEEREAMGRRARTYAERNADSQACLRKIEAFYLDVVRRSREGTSPA